MFWGVTHGTQQHRHRLLGAKAALPPNAFLKGPGPLNIQRAFSSAHCLLAMSGRCMGAPSISYRRWLLCLTMWMSFPYAIIPFRWRVCVCLLQLLGLTNLMNLLFSTISNCAPSSVIKWLAHSTKWYYHTSIGVKWSHLMGNWLKCS